MKDAIRTLVLFFLFLSMSCFSWGDSPGHATMTRAQILGFHGPIHTQKCQTRELAKDPRLQPKLSIRSLHKPWMVFNASGELVEESDLDAAGGLAVVVHRAYDERGEEVGTEIVDGEKTRHMRTEKTMGPSGPTEIRTYADDKLISRIVESYREHGDGGESRVFDGNGTLTSYSRSQRDKFSQSSEVWGAQGKFVSHFVRRFGPDGDLVQSSRYDESGKLVSDLSFSKGRLTSFWQDPECACTNIAAYNFPGDYTVFYQTDKDGKLFKEIQHHKGRSTNHEIDDQELRDENDRLLERIAYAYERDAQGNWIKRTVSVLNPETGAMVAIREDVRELTYY